VTAGPRFLRTSTFSYSRVQCRGGVSRQLIGCIRGTSPEQHRFHFSHRSRQLAIKISVGSVFPCFRKNLIRFNCPSDIFSALGSRFHIRFGGFLASSVIALTTHALAFEELAGLTLLRDLEIIGNRFLFFTEVLLCLHLLFTVSINPTAGLNPVKSAPTHSCKEPLATARKTRCAKWRIKWVKTQK
jgi:hypothetical protein